MVNYNGLMFQNTLDSLRESEATIAALIDMVEGNPFAPFEYPWMLRAMQSRGLAEFKTGSFDQTTNMYTGPIGVFLTDYGAAFVAWLREPRELPIQMELF